MLNPITYVALMELVVFFWVKSFAVARWRACFSGVINCGSTVCVYHRLMPCFLFRCIQERQLGVRWISVPPNQQ